MGRRQKKGRYAADSGESQKAKARANHSFALDFGGIAILASRSSLTCARTSRKP